MDSAVKYLSHCVAPFQFFGHHYFSISSLTPENQNKFPSLGYTLYFIFVLVTMTGQMLIFAQHISSNGLNEKLSSKTVLNYLIQHSMYAGLVFIIWVSLIQSYIATPLKKKFFLNCLRLGRISEQSFNHSIDQRRFRRNVFQYFLYIVLYISVLEISLFLYEQIYDDLEDTFRFCLSVVPIIFLNVTSFNFIFYVKLINFHLEAVEKLTIEIFDSPKLLENLNLFIKSVKPRKSADVSLKLRNLRRIFNIICENSEIVNRAMGMTVLSITAVLVIVITASGYRIFLSILGKLPIEKIGGKEF